MASASATTSSSNGSSSPCGACKFLRRKCERDCIFAPYFNSELGSEQFSAIHKVFGASNVSKLLRQIPQNDRAEAAETIAYEAQARIRDPVYGCVGLIYGLQQQVVSLQLQLMQAKAQLTHSSLVSPQSSGNHWQDNIASSSLVNPPLYNSYEESMSPQSSLDCIDNMSTQYLPMQEMSYGEGFTTSSNCITNAEMDEFQALVFRTLGN